MIRKSLFLSFLLTGLMTCMLGGSTYAFFTDSCEATAGMETGTVKIIVTGQKSTGGCGDDETEISADCVGQDDGYLAEWEIKNVGSNPVYLSAVLATPVWTKISPVPGKVSADESGGLLHQRTGDPKSPKIVPNSVAGWRLSNGRYLYTGGSLPPKEKVLGRNQSVSFTLPFTADGRSGTSYRLKLCLKVTAVQAVPAAAAAAADEKDDDL